MVDIRLFREVAFPLQEHGWGDNLVIQVRELAAAEVKYLVLFHHGPERAAGESDAIQEEPHLWLQQRHPEAWRPAAFEELAIEVGESKSSLPRFAARTLSPCRKPIGHLERGLRGLTQLFF